MANIGSTNSFISAATSDFSARASILIQLKTGNRHGKNGIEKKKLLNVTMYQNVVSLTRRIHDGMGVAATRFLGESFSSRKGSFNNGHDVRKMSFDFALNGDGVESDRTKGRRSLTFAS